MNIMSNHLFQFEPIVIPCNNVYFFGLPDFLSWVVLLLCESIELIRSLSSEKTVCNKCCCWSSRPSAGESFGRRLSKFAFIFFLLRVKEITKLNPVKNFSLQGRRFESFLVVKKYFRLLWSVINLIQIFVASSSCFNCSNYWITIFFGDSI